MAKIYPDTNRFVDFYQAALDQLDVFDDLQKYKTSLVLTEQTITEFRRNRVSTLKWLFAQFRKSIEIGSPYTTTVLRAFPEHKELTDLWSSYRRKGQEVLKQLGDLIADESKDPIAQKFFALVKDPTVLKLQLTDEAIKAAQRRKLLGNPPCSPDKYSVGDEVIWELLIGGLKEDLIVVTKDQTFHENFSLLSEEYQQRTGHRLLLVTEKYSGALKAVGQAPPERLLEVEKQEELRPAPKPRGPFSHEQLKAMIDREICPSCGKEGQLFGYDGSDGDSFDWFECRHCGLLCDINGA
ncbi:PIN domain-containing protein [Sorangium sp. So ce764]|uniref:PIN domain-containing protein n=1 Tax=Sorangium sp. So ce764 TaxID=3133320 RepID=UPI003F5FE2F0